MTGWSGCSSLFSLRGKKAAITRPLVLFPPQLEINFVVYVVGEARLRRRLRLAELVQLLQRHCGCGCGGAAAAWPLPAVPVCFGGGIRTCSPGVIFPR